MNFLGLEDRVWLWMASVCYVTGFGLGTAYLLRERRQSRLAQYGIVAAGFLLQTLGLYLRGRAVKGCPIGNTFEIFQFTAWSAISLYLVIGATFRLSLLGYFTSCLSAVLTLVSLAMPRAAWDPEPRATGIFGDSAWIEFHAALALFSYGVFGLLALTSLMYLLQTYSLKHKRLHGLFSFLPSIIELDRISVRLLVTGVVLLTWSLGIGSVHWVQDVASVDPPKLVGTVAVWLAYTLVMTFRLRSRLVSTRFAWIGLLLFAGALLTLPLINASRHPARPPPTPATQG
ncbi:MAG: cytochrome C biogenesis protein [Verrucomicrobia bacterium RIFCSPLOWO2_12_FULL_64_8]|nr:MAG: cytochrome C biogenesis protein [Verrucomicrobia bacterium RIFCSPLOWO2_12_FULL_64_8]